MLEYMESTQITLSKKHVWILADADKVGSQNQCIGLVERLGYSYDLKKINLNFFYKVVAPFFYFGSRYFAGADLCGPYPDFIVASGRQAASVAASLRHKAKTIFLLDPYLPSSFFDVVIVPFHDMRWGRTRKSKNVIKILGSLHGLTGEKVKTAAKRAMTDTLKKSHVVVLLGGDSRHFKYSDIHIRLMIEKLKKLSAFMGGVRFLITPSRRTTPEVIHQCQHALQGTEFYMWDFEGENPYHSFLGQADVIVATSDSISMTSEACSVGVPVFIEDLKINNPKFKSYFKMLFEKRHAYKFSENNFAKMHEKTRILDEFPKVEKFLKNKNIIG